MVKCSKCNNYSDYATLHKRCIHCGFYWILCESVTHIDNVIYEGIYKPNNYYYIVYEEIDSSMIPSVFYAMIEGSPFDWLNNANEHYDPSLRVNIRFYSEVTKEEYDSFKGLTF